jgi:hypothetical protein
MSQKKKYKKRKIIKPKIVYKKAELKIEDIELKINNAFDLLFEAVLKVK